MKFTIDIISDTVCPWCFVGFKRLQKGIAAYKSTNPDSTFEIKWHPFYLNPAAPKVGVDKLNMYYEKFGKERTNMMQKRIGGIGQEEGIAFSFGGKTGNTRDSHRLVALAATKGLQTPLVESLFHTYFEAEGDITSHTVLKDAAVSAGLDAVDVERWLKTDEGGAEVDKGVNWARQQQISGVPHFIINKGPELGGAQDPDAFVEVFESLEK